MKKFLNTYKLLAILFFSLSFLGSKAQTTPLTFSILPYTQPDFIYNPGKGMENWIGQNTINVPSQGTNTARNDMFWRFSWSDIQSFNSSISTYQFTNFDNLVNSCITNNQTFSFAIMINFGNCTNSGGACMTYPLGMHNAMQGESTKDLISGGTWYENTNSASFLTWFTALNQAIANHIASTSFNGVPYSKVVRRVDARFMGDFGENIVLPDKAALQAVNGVPTTAAIENLLTMYKNVYPNLWIMNMIGTFSAGFPGPSGVGATPIDASAFALNISNNRGPFGWRRDNWMRTDGYIRGLTDQNTNTFGGMRFDTAIMNRYKRAPVGGEPEWDDPGGLSDDADFPIEVQRYHAQSVGNGNYTAAMNSSIANNVRAASLLMGYRLNLTGGNMTSSPVLNSTMNITINWQNVGLTPAYDTWVVQYELRNGTTVAWTGTSSMNLTAFQPNTSAATAISDNFTISGFAAGTYSLYIIVRDASGYRAPLPLAISGRGSDGAYLVRSNITIGGSGGGPIANAGSNQTITLPTNSVALSASASTGTITSYAWSQVSGPNTASLSTPTSVTTNATGLIQGTYVFQVSVNGGVSTAQVTITVNPAAAPVANAGNNQTITLPTSSVTLSGAASTGTITSYSWTQVSGPSTATITTPTTVTTSVTGLVQGTYVFRLSLNGNVSSATVSVVVNAVSTSVSVFTTQAPASTTVLNDGSAIVVGMRFRASQAGNITSLKFYKEVGFTGTHTGLLYTNAGALLAQVNYTETASGWQTATLSSPVAIAANTTYVVAVLSADGNYSADNGWFANQATVNGVMSGLQDGTDGSNGIYIYSSTPAFPNSTFSSSNYWVDAVFSLLPTANAGSDQTITLPTSSASLSGAASTGTITSYSWTQVSGPNTASITTPSSVNTTVTGLIQGSYVFKLSINGAVSTDQVTITVNAGAVAVAGADQSITLPTSTVTLNGGGSSGTITSVSWTRVSGPNTPTITTPTNLSTPVTGLIAGTYVFQLSLNGGTSTDQVTITVLAAPVANAGPDQSITLPTSSVTLTAAASTGSITSYTWTRISGPNTPTITTPSTVTTTVTGLVAGTYVFQVSLNAGASTDQVSIVVNPAPAPVANAGNNQTITLPTSSVSLTGAASTGTITSYAWTQVSGPNTGSITTPTTVNTTVTGLIAGTYVFQLSLNGGTSVDQVTVTVLAAAVANAGPNQTITLPTSSVSLTGAASTGTISSYAWSRISGPNTPTITTPTTVNTTVTGLIAGTYIFQLSINGGTSTSQVTIIVNPIPAPVANAGPNQTITLPTSSVALTAAASTGTITSYLWSQVSGPNTASFSTPTTVTTNATGLIAGTYVFKITLNGGTASANVTITVNTAPVANAGADQSVILPTSTVTLNGAASTGTITSFLWTRISGPNTPTVTSPTSSSTTVTGLIAGTYVFQLSLNSGASTDQVTVTVGPAPAANAGPDQSITLPTNSVTLDGTGSTGTIISYTWSRVSGPNTPTIVTPAGSTTSVTGLIAGTYVFQLSLNSGASTNQVTITVNAAAAPVANAGPNQTITLPTSSANLTAAASTGVISTYTWTQVSGPNTATITTPSTVTTTVTGLIAGTYVFRISLNSGVSTDQVTITVNAAAVANAGPNQTITLPTNSVTLDASGSTGTISSYSWTRVSGPNTPTITTPTTVSTTVTGLIAGTYIFQISINSGASTSQVTVIVNPAPPPVANAGPNQTITLPTSSVSLTASASTGTITSYLWTQVSGPNTASITTPATVGTTVTGLVAGTYVFKVSLNGGTATSTVTITVNVAAVANAGADQTITLPPSSVTLNGGGSTGVITSYLWTLVSGPNSPTITTPTTVGTTVTGLIAGTYVFQLSINSGASTDQVTITVNPAPVANAGGDQTITLPTSSVTVSGSASTGTITSYAWSRISGPNTPTITTPSSVSTTITGLVQGTYVFQLSLNGGVSVDQVTITVNATPTPVANAGGDQTITLPTNTVTLNGSGSTGTITTYTWTRVSGPNTPTITTPSSVSTTVTGLVAGTYVFQLSLNGGVSVDQVTIIVNPAPVANAGPDQTITLPTSSVTLNGSNSTGPITSFTWTRVSGPNTPTIVSPSSATTTVTGLIQGSYVFQVSVNGGVSTDQVTITVNAAPSIIANAGPDQNISLPTSSVTLNGTGSSGPITSYTWTQISGPNTASIATPSTVTTNVTGLIAGRYIFQLSVNSGASTDQVIINVNAVPAVANAGPNQTITLPTSSVTLTGAASTGTINNYAWTLVSGPSNPVITTPTTVTTTVTGLIQGTYVFQLALNQSASTDQVTIVVNAPVVANAGPNQTITLPTSTVNLTGAASTGAITTYLWTRVSGPNTPTITTPNSVTTSVTGLVQGVYQFRLSLNGGASTATVIITVNPALAANAGPDQTITLPLNSVTLTGAASVGVITSYAWTRISGPNSPTITTPSTVTTTVTGLIQGTYVFQLSLNGGLSTDQVTITVNASAAVHANAGPDQGINLPTSSVTLNGSSSTGTITTYAWTRVSGPNTPTIVSPSSVSTSVTGLIAGTYVFQLSVNSGASTDQLTVTVNSVGSTIHIFTNQTPPTKVSNDGTPLELGMKFRSTQAGYVVGIRFYKGTGNSGTHIGEIYSRARTRLAQKTFTGETSSGWQDATFNTAVPIFANTTYVAALFSSSGNYTFSAQGFISGVTNSPLQALSNVQDGPNGVYSYSGTPIYPSSTYNANNYWIDITFQPNVAPVAIITGASTVALPTSNVVLSGTSSTSTFGTISRYRWSQVSGPNTATIVSGFSSSTNITGLVSGVYVFTLTVTDNLGATSTSTKTVSVQ